MTDYRWMEWRLVHLPDADRQVYVGTWYGRTEHGRVWQAVATCTPEQWTHPDLVAAKRLNAYQSVVAACAGVLA